MRRYLHYNESAILSNREFRDSMSDALGAFCFKFFKQNV